MGKIYGLKIDGSILEATSITAKASKTQTICLLRKKAWLDIFALPSAKALDEEYTITEPITINIETKASKRLSIL